MQPKIDEMTLTTKNAPPGMAMLYLRAKFMPARLGLQILEIIIAHNEDEARRARGAPDG